MLPVRHRGQFLVEHSKGPLRQHRGSIVLDCVGGISTKTSHTVMSSDSGLHIPLRTKADASIDDFLCATLDFCVATLHARKVQIRRAVSGLDTRSSATTKTDKHCWSTKHNKMCAWPDKIRWLERIVWANCTDTTGNHDWFVVPPHLLLTFKTMLERYDQRDISREGRSLP